MCHCYPSCENKSFLIPTEGKNISFSPNKRKSERSERVSLWWKWHIFWLREGLKCFYLSCEGNTGILLLVMDSWQFFGKFQTSSVNLPFLGLFSWTTHQQRPTFRVFFNFDLSVDLSRQIHNCQGVHLCPSQNQNIRLSEAEARYS